MRQITAFGLAGIVATYPWPRSGVICDVAGGVGLLLAGILERRPRARGIHHDRARPDGLTPMMDLPMLVCCEGGRERSPQEVHALMRDAGLKPGRVRHAGVMMLVEGVAA
jgi:hypothetical protein